MLASQQRESDNFERSSRAASAPKESSNNNNNGVRGSKQKKKGWTPEQETFAKKCCIQFSPMFRSLRTAAKDVAAFREFIVMHAHEHGEVMARVIVWRLAAAADGSGSVSESSSNAADLFGAWSLVVYAFRLSELSQENLAATDYSPQALQWDLVRLLEPFLKHLVEAYWFGGGAKFGTASGDLEELLVNSNGNRAADAIEVGEVLDDMKRRLFLRYARQQNHQSLNIARNIAQPGAGGVGAPISSNNAATVDVEVSAAYRQLEAQWLGMMRRDYAEEFKRLFSRVRARGNAPMSKETERFVRPPARFYEYLASMRLDAPRPSHIKEVQEVYFAYERKKKNNSNTNTNDDEEEHHHQHLSTAIHPRIISWFRKLKHEAHCEKCDTWKHDKARCPCVLGVQRLAPRRPPANAPPGAKPRPPPTLSYGEAVAKLAQYEIKVPPVNNAAVLDLVTQMIMSELPYDTVLEAFDVVRGYRTGVTERHALWLHAGYNLLPSKTALADDSDSMSACMLRVKTHLEKSHRVGEYLRLEDAVDMLNDIFKRNRLPSYIADDLEVIRDSTRSSRRRRRNDSYFDRVPGGFFFLHLEYPTMDDFPASDFARGDLSIIEPFAGYLCRNCLTPFHRAECCTVRKQSWDLHVAQTILDYYGLVGLRQEEFDQRRGDVCTRLISDCTMDEGDRDLKQQKIEFDVACALLERGGPGGKAVPYCGRCKVYDHSGRTCEEDLKVTMQRNKWSETYCRLYPHVIEGVIQREERMFEDQKRRAVDEGQPEPREPMSLKKLKDVRYAYCHASKVFPSRYGAAVELFERRGYELHAARYSPEAFSRLVVACGLADLKAAFDVVCEPNFPEVCIYCGSVMHDSTDCDRARGKQSEIQFIRELLNVHHTPLSAFTIALLCAHRLPARMPSAAVNSNGAVSGRSGGSSSSSSHVIAGPALLPTAFPEGRTSLVQYLRYKLDDAYSPNGQLIGKVDQLRKSLDLIRQHNISVGLCKYNEQRARKYARIQCDALGSDPILEKKLLDAIATVGNDQSIDVCFVCGEVNTHKTKECRLFNAEPMDVLDRSFEYHEWSVKRYLQKEVIDKLADFPVLRGPIDYSRYADLQDSIYKRWEYNYTVDGIADQREKEMEEQRRRAPPAKRPREDDVVAMDSNTAGISSSYAAPVVEANLDEELPTVDADE
jgi:hypothetical protein